MWTAKQVEFWWAGHVYHGSATQKMQGRRWSHFLQMKLEGERCVITQPPCVFLFLVSFHFISTLAQTYKII